MQTESPLDKHDMQCTHIYYLFSINMCACMRNYMPMNIQAQFVPSAYGNEAKEEDESEDEDDSEEEEEAVMGDEAEDASLLATYLPRLIKKIIFQPSKHQYDQCNLCDNKCICLCFIILII